MPENTGKLAIRGNDCRYPTCALPCVEWHDDHEAIYLHIQTKPKNKEFWMDQIEVGNLIFDVNHYDPEDIIGVEMLSRPEVPDVTVWNGVLVSPSLWMRIGYAWDSAQQARTNSKGAHRGEFTIR